MRLFLFLSIVAICSPGLALAQDPDAQDPDAQDPDAQDPDAQDAPGPDQDADPRAEPEPQADGPTADGVDPVAEPSPDELARARQVFQRGVELAARGEFARAARKFTEALSIREAPAIRYNLASALFEMGRLVEAFETNRAVVQATEVPDGVRQRSARLQQELVAAIGRLTIELVGDADGVAVTIDDAPVDASRLGLELPVAPGLHVLVANRDGDVLTRREIRLEPGTATVVELHLFATPEEAAAAGVDPVAAGLVAGPAEPEGRSKLGLWLGLGVGAAALAAVITIVAVSVGGAQGAVRGDYEPGVLTWR